MSPLIVTQIIEFSLPDKRVFQKSLHFLNLILEIIFHRGNSLIFRLVNSFPESFELNPKEGHFDSAIRAGSNCDRSREIPVELDGRLGMLEAEFIEKSLLSISVDSLVLLHESLPFEDDFFLLQSLLLNLGLFGFSFLFSVQTGRLFIGDFSTENSPVTHLEGSSDLLKIDSFEDEFWLWFVALGEILN